MKESNNLGSLGEDLACKHLRGLGWRILYRNKRWSFGELDIVARNREGALVFVEVKTRVAGESPEQNYTQEKDRKTKRVARYFVQAFPELIHEDSGFRVDLIAIEVDMAGNNKQVIRHYENV